MKKTVIVSVCGLFSALSAVIMLISYFPSLTYAVPAVAGVIFMVPLLEFGSKYAFICYGVTAVIAFLTAETESKVLFVCFFGFYPIVAILISRIKSKLLKYTIKLAIFNIAVVLAYLLITAVFGIAFTGEFGLTAEIFALCLLLIGNVVFILYDIAVDRLYLAYCFKWRKSVRKILKLGK